MSFGTLVYAHVELVIGGSFLYVIRQCCPVSEERDYSMLVCLETTVTIVL